MHFSELLKQCTNPESPRQLETAWYEFMKRYKTHIYSAVTRRCMSWNVPRLDRQISDVVNDIASEVFVIIYKSLAGFKEIEYERKFIIWLTTICSRSSSHYLQRQFMHTLTDLDIEVFQDVIGGLSFDSRWELYESAADRMRSVQSSKKKNLERDINIFLMYVWSDFSDKMVLTHPCYSSLGGRVIDNVINRMRSVLREDKKL